MNEKLNTLLQDESFIKKLVTQETDIDVQKLLKENDVDISLEEIAAIRKGIESRLSNSDELSDDDLENVAGGTDVDGIITLAVDVLCKLGDKIHEWTRRRW